MNGKEKHSPIKKYLEVKEFVEYCKANNVDASLNLLESYEKVGLLIPFYRFVAPDEYIHALFEYNYKITIGQHVQFDDKKWHEIEQLRTALRSYSFKPLPHFDFALKNGHPLDVAYRNKNPFLQKLSKESFKPWKEYTIVGGTLDGHPVKEETSEHYYTPWQIFVLDELNIMHTIEENYATKQRKGWGIIKKELSPSKLDIFYEYFQTVCNFRMMEALIWHDISFDVKGMVIEGELYRQFETRTGEQAKMGYEKHSDSEWIKFIRKLVELYREYSKREKIKLADEVKCFLTSTINILMDATKKSYEEICNTYDGRFKDFLGKSIDKGTVIYPGELERIYPDEIKEIKKRVRRTLDFQIKQLKETLSNNLKTVDVIIDALINNVIENGHYLLLSHLYEIEALWFDRRPRWESSIWAHLRSFAVSIESVSHEWYGQDTFGKILDYAFKKDYLNLRDSICKDITDAKTPSEYKQKIAKILEHKKRSIPSICSYHLVSAHLTRNYFSHNTKFEPDMLGSTFIEVYKDLVFTLISLFIKKTSNDKF